MTIYEKLAQVQQVLKAPKGQYNKFGNYNYRSCEDILNSLKEPLKEVKTTIMITDDLEMVGDRYYVKATVTFIDLETGEKLTNTAFAREDANKKGMDGSQITGATSSYCRKYALNGMFMIDDTKDADTEEYEISNGLKAVKQKNEQKPKADEVLKEKGADLKNHVNELVKQKKITKKKTLDIMRKHGTDSFDLLTSEKQYEDILADIKKEVGE